MVNVLPELAQLRRLRAEPIPVLDLYFNKMLGGLPTEYVALLGSRYGLSFVDISQHHGRGRTALAIAASDFYALPEPLETEIPRTAGPAAGRSERVLDYLDTFAILRELQHYLHFNPGKFWGDGDSDIDWENTLFQPNTTREVFINEVGSELWSPDSKTSIPNLFFAGDFCKTSISITTVEAAVMSGLKAAKALWETERHGPSVEIEQPDQYPLSYIMTLKLLMTPYAYAAKCWSATNDAISDLSRGRAPAKLGSNIGSLFTAPGLFVGDWWRTLWALGADLLSGGEGRRD